LDDSRKLVRHLKKRDSDEKRNKTEFRRCHGLEDERKHAEYIECISSQQEPIGGRLYYYGDENHNPSIRRCLEQVKTGAGTGVHSASREVKSGSFGAFDDFCCKRVSVKDLPVKKYTAFWDFIYR
jgi:hypothetical protein